MRKPVIAIPMGDPAGIGPEIVIRAMVNCQVSSQTSCVVIGDKSVIEQAMTFPRMPQVELNIITDPAEGRYTEGVLNLIDLHNVNVGDLKIGKVSGMCGQAAYQYIEEAIRMAMSGKADAVTTTPINKESLRAGGIPYIGHTEIFGALTGTEDPLTMFEVRNMRVFFLSRHVSLREACDAVVKERIVDYVRRCTEALRKLGVDHGSMAIAGLNPHSGEHGLFGNEEVREVIPAVDELKGMGYDVEGPVGADSVFHLALQGKYNSVLSLYHDQGHIATKTLDFYRTISVTAGMPILRTSVDHGTAFDVAGKGVASSVSMEEAILIAAKYAPAFVRSSAGRQSVMKCPDT